MAASLAGRCCPLPGHAIARHWLAEPLRSPGLHGSEPVVHPPPGLLGGNEGNAEQLPIAAARRRRQFEAVGRAREGPSFFSAWLMSSLPRPPERCQTAARKEDVLMHFVQSATFKVSIPAYGRRTMQVKNIAVVCGLAVLMSGCASSKFSYQPHMEPKFQIAKEWTWNLMSIGTA